MNEQQLEQEIVEAVSYINEIIFETEEELPQLMYITNGCQSKVTWLGEILWVEDDDCREYDENKDEYEPMKQCLLRECNIILEHLFNLKNAFLKI